MSKLSSPHSAMREHYTVVVVGSGYGGGIAASRLARAGQDVCVLERGREFLTGEFPDTEAEALDEMQVDGPLVDADAEGFNDRLGLFDFRLNPDINVLVGCGLGGTSLINANVALEAEPRVFDDPAWPAPLRAPGALDDGVARARAMLRPVPLPESARHLPKHAAHVASADALGAACQRPPIAVTFEAGENAAGVHQEACLHCGDCVSGCNYGAKNTTMMNYLPDAKRHGAEIFVEAEVRRVERRGDAWVVHYRPAARGRERFRAPDAFVRADVVVLAAGTLGSTEILLRSKAHGLAASAQLGKRFTGNGDVLAFAYNCDREVNGVGWGDRRRADDPVGPCITGLIDLRHQPRLEDGMVVEEGSIPGALNGLLPSAFWIAGRTGRDTDKGMWDALREHKREAESLLRGAYHGAVANTQTYLVMAHDDAAGEMRLQDDRLRIDWPDVADQAVFAKVEANLYRATEKLGGTFVRNPITNKLLGKRLVTVHPLGGCSMAEDAERGVTNERGQVFDGEAGDSVYEGLYVLDGAVMPRSLGVNPLLTISAIAERNCALLASDRGWSIDYDSRGGALPVPSEAVGIRFTETMRGFVSSRVTDEGAFANAYAAGRDDGSAFEFTLTVETDDLEGMLGSDAHPARMSGTATCPLLSDGALAVSDGEFQLFTVDDDVVAGRRMQYRMLLTAPDGRHFRFEGFKKVVDDRGLDLWADTTTLFVTIRDGEDASAPVLALGELRIEPLDFARQMRTMTVTNATGTRQRLGAIARFGGFFAGSLFDVYGGVFRRDRPFDPAAPPRKRRELRAPTPEVFPLEARDGKRIRLTRFQAGARRPVLLGHGLGVSSRIFTIDTIETNLVEYLCALGHDVWLLDYRQSIELPTAEEPSTGDDVARSDWPAAVDFVRGHTGYDAIDAIGHCFGATTLTMAMLDGMDGVRSMVCSQISAHVTAPLMTRLKTGLYVPSILERLDVDVLDAYTDRADGWRDRLANLVLRVYPTELEEWCDNPVCRRIAFMYAPLYEHDQLNHATHEAMHEMFGVANMQAFKHLAAIVRAGHVVDAGENEVYLPNLARLDLPITFVHGEENDCFLPESTKRTYDVLRETFGRAQYRRHVVSEYGHIDCIFGKHASRDVFPHIGEHFERLQ